MPQHELILTGYKYSVYTRSLRIVLAEKGVAYAYEELNPFDHEDAQALQKKHPFGRVPVLQHGAFTLWESAAMLEYINVRFDGPDMVPEGARAAARMRQVIAVMDNYAYWPLVRQVFSQSVFRLAMAEESDPAMMQEGLAVAPLVLATLEGFAAEGMVLAKGQVCLAACHALPMLEYFVQAPEGHDMLRRYKTLSQWLECMGQRTSANDTRPNLDALAKGQKQ